MNSAGPDQFRVRFDWGPMGLRTLAPHVDVVIVVDVLSFTTCVDVALGRGTDDPVYTMSDGSALPSPNGSALVLDADETGASEVVAACIRNGAAVGSTFADEDLSVGVLAVGARWPGSADLRVAVEDLLGAGAVLSVFDRLDLSPEARAAAAAWHDAEPDILDRLRTSVSGREFEERGWADDVALAAQAHVSDLVPVLRDGRFVDRTG